MEYRAAESNNGNNGGCTSEKGGFQALGEASERNRKDLA